MSQKAVTDFFIFCPPKCGTTSLFHMLSQHPELSPCNIKEPHFFSINYTNGLEWYNNLFEKNDKQKFEASTSYFSNERATKRLKKNLDKQPKLIIVLRNPVERFISLYKHFRAVYRIVNDESLYNNFLSSISWAEQFVENNFSGLGLSIQQWQNKEYDINDQHFKMFEQAIECGMYYKHICDLSDNLNCSMLLLEYNEFKQDNIKTIHTIENFLDISNFDGYKKLDYNQSSDWEKFIDVKSDITKDFTDNLHELYRSSNTQLEKFLNTKLNWD